MSRDMSRRSAFGAKADRDHILEQALTQELRSMNGPLTPDCLDAETIAAWEDGALDARQMEAAELHLSNCVRCQSLAGAMARGVPAAAPVEEHKGFRLWSWWLAPIAAATAAVTLWMVVPEQQQIATAPPARDAVAAPAAKAESAATAESKQQPKLEADQAAKKDRAQAPAAAPFAERDDRRERQANEPADKNKVEAGKRASEEKLASSADAVAPAAPAATAMLQKSARLATVIEVVSPDGSRRWRFADYRESLTTGAAVSSSICWLAGREGVVMLTTDGSTFERVDLPARVDIVSIAATDARAATVTTVDGRTFRTDDSGRNWRQN